MLGSGLGLALAVAMPGVAQASVVVDQAVLVPPSGDVAVVALAGTVTTPTPGYRSGIQTFTAGTAGILDHLDFQLFWATAGTDGIYSLTLYSGDLIGSPATATLQFVQLGQLSTLPGSAAARAQTALTTFDVRAAGFVVAPGTRYSVAFDAAAGMGRMGVIIGYGVGTPPNPPTIFGTNYAGGGFQQLSNGVGGPVTPSRDAGFVSYVSLNVPEPGTWGMMILGLGAVGGAMRRGRAAGRGNGLAAVAA
ncbi:PEPxxWA-CTERM sorting domain-containing protein [Sphingomonas sp.]|uniref:PEPxxWA-CTERM sorting domain-containing protein n=1 Tax=Sphingomonas sp. TaxID=28214 RepID=UPI001B0F6C9F|nr:PEPxxWA-CTERM sorting domain-containing protein [Sphingomonas sp.]MBO9715169.1 PEPxxWA-CTERM sorting domain-containing protein [Sphingomonas sp.]